MAVGARSPDRAPTMASHLALLGHGLLTVPSRRVSLRGITMNNRIDRDRRSRRHRRPSQGLATAQPGASPDSPSEPTRGKGRLWLVLLICLAGSTAASFVVFKY